MDGPNPSVRGFIPAQHLPSPRRSHFQLTHFGWCLKPAISGGVLVGEVQATTVKQPQEKPGKFGVLLANLGDSHLGDFGCVHLRFDVRFVGFTLISEFHIPVPD